MRTVGAVIVGYIVIAVLVIGLMFGAAFALGIDGMYQKDTYEVTTTWAVTSLVIGLFAAVVGGLVCARVGGGKGPSRVLAGLILCIGVGMAAWSAAGPAPSEAPPARTPQTPLTEIAKHSVQPAWLGWANPFVGAAGVLLGGRRRSRGVPAASVSSPR